MRWSERLTGAVALLAVVVCLAVVACGGAASTDGGDGSEPASGAEPARRSSLVLALQQEPDRLSSALNSMVVTNTVSRPIFGYLVHYDDQMKLVPGVIEEVPTLENGGIRPDGLEITYRLRAGLRWHDGVPFTCEDVRFTHEAIMDRRHEIETRQGYDKVASIRCPDPLTLVVTLKEPYAPFVSSFFSGYGLWPKHILGPAVGVDFGRHPFFRHPIGLGPYRFVEWVSGSHVTLDANPDYFRGRPAIDRLTFRFIPDANASLMALQAGEIDGYDNAATSHVETLKSLAGVRVYVTPSLMWEHIDLNTDNPILADVRVRRAIQFALDRRQISEEIYRGLWPVARGDMSPRLPWYNPVVETLVRRDVAAAAALLDGAGWHMGDDGLRHREGQTLRLRLSTTAGRAERELTEQVVQQQLAALGIEVVIQNYNATTLFAPADSGGVLRGGRYDMAMYAWLTDPDPNRRSLYHSGEIPPQGQNIPRFRHARLDELLEEGLRRIDPTERKVIYDEVQEIIAREVPMTPLVWRSDIDVVPARLKNYRPNPTQTGDTWNTWEWRLED